jgi:hypothetical protein
MLKELTRVLKNKIRTREINKVSKKENKKTEAFIQHKEKKGEKGKDRKYMREDRKKGKINKEKITKYSDKERKEGRRE